MSNIAIVADSTCDLSEELLSQYQIQLIPLCIVLNGKSYYDREEITTEEIFRWSDENKTTPQTAAVTIERVEQTLKPLMEQKKDILFFGISEDMSTTCNVVRLVGKELGYERLFVIDSQNLSSGIGLQILRAADMAAEGKSAEEIVSLIEAKRDSVRASFVVDKLTYLARGGRCNAVTALFATKLMIRPRIDVKNGKMGVGQRYRGVYKKVVLKYVKEMEQALLSARKDRVFITYPSCDPDIVAEVKAYLESLHYFEHIYTTNASGVISSHCGPGTIGVLYYVD